MLITSNRHVPSILPLRPSSQPIAAGRRFCNAIIAFAVLAGSVYAPAMLSAQPAEGTCQPTKQSGCRVAVIDVVDIFRNLPAIKTHFSKVRREQEQDKLELKQRRDALNHAVKQLKTLKVGSLNYARQEEYVARLDSQFRMPRIYKHQGLSESEARLFYDTYQQIAAASRSIAIENDIQLVLNIDGEQMDVNQTDSVDRGVMKNVLYHDSTVNITSIVKQYLEQQGNAPVEPIRGKAAPSTNR